MLDIVRGRRSIRRFKPNHVPKEYLDLIFEAARWTPSAGNRQPLRYVTVTNPDKILKIGEIYQKIRATELAELPKDSPRYNVVNERVKSNFYRDIFVTAPINIVVCGVPKESFRMRTYVLDCALAIQNMLLMAHAVGLGSVYINFDRPEHDNLVKQIARMLGIPGDVKIMAILPLGYPDEQPTPPPRREIREIVFDEKYSG